MNMDLLDMVSGSLLSHAVVVYSTKGKFQKINKIMDGFIQRTSDPSQPGRALDKKKSKITRLYVFIIFIITKFGENFEEKIDICGGSNKKHRF